MRLSNETNGISETKAATELAVKNAKVEARNPIFSNNSGTIPPSAYPEGYSVSAISNGTGFPTTYGTAHTYRTGNVRATQMFYPAINSSAVFTRQQKDSALDEWTPFVRQIDESMKNVPGGYVGIGSDGAPQVASKKTKLFEINLAQNPSLVVSINNLSNYKDFTMIFKNVVNTHVSTNELQIRVNGLATSTDYMGYVVLGSTLSNSARTSISSISGITNSESVNGTLEIESDDFIRGIGFLLRTGIDTKMQGFTKSEIALRDHTIKIVNSLQIDYKNASTTMNSGIIELWGNPR